MPQRRTPDLQTPSLLAPQVRPGSSLSPVNVPAPELTAPANIAGHFEAAAQLFKGILSDRVEAKNATRKTAAKDFTSSLATQLQKEYGNLSPSQRQSPAVQRRIFDLIEKAGFRNPVYIGEIRRGLGEDRAKKDAEDILVFSRQIVGDPQASTKLNEFIRAKREEAADGVLAADNLARTGYNNTLSARVEGIKINFTQEQATEEKQQVINRIRGEVANGSPDGSLHGLDVLKDASTDLNQAFAEINQILDSGGDIFFDKAQMFVSGLSLAVAQEDDAEVQRQMYERSLAMVGSDGFPFENLRANPDLIRVDQDITRRQEEQSNRKGAEYGRNLKLTESRIENLIINHIEGGGNSASAKEMIRGLVATLGQEGNPLNDITEHLLPSEVIAIGITAAGEEVDRNRLRSEALDKSIINQIQGLRSLGDPEALEAARLLAYNITDLALQDRELRRFDGSDIWTKAIGASQEFREMNTDLDRLQVRLSDFPAELQEEVSAIAAVTEEVRTFPSEIPVNEEEAAGIVSTRVQALQGRLASAKAKLTEFTAGSAKASNDIVGALGDFDLAGARQVLAENGKNMTVSGRAEARAGIQDLSEAINRGENEVLGRIVSDVAGFLQSNEEFLARDDQEPIQIALRDRALTESAALVQEYIAQGGDPSLLRGSVVDGLAKPIAEEMAKSVLQEGAVLSLNDLQKEVKDYNAQLALIGGVVQSQELEPLDRIYEGALARGTGKQLQDLSAQLTTLKTDVADVLRSNPSIFSDTREETLSSTLGSAFLLSVTETDRRGILALALSSFPEGVNQDLTSVSVDASLLSASGELLSETLKDFPGFSSFSREDVVALQELTTKTSSASVLLSDGTVVTTFPEKFLVGPEGKKPIRGSLRFDIPIPDDLEVGPSLVLNPNTDPATLYDSNPQRIRKLMGLPEDDTQALAILKAEGNLRQAIIERLAANKTFGKALLR